MAATKTNVRKAEIEVRKADAVWSFVGYLKKLGCGDYEDYAEKFCTANELTNYHEEFLWPEERKILLGVYCVSADFGIYDGVRGYKVQGARTMRSELERFGTNKQLIVATNSQSPLLRGFVRRDPVFLWSRRTKGDWPLTVADCCELAQITPPRFTTDVVHMAEIYRNLIDRWDELEKSK